MNVPTEPIGSIPLMTARKRGEEELLAAREALRESEQRFRAVFERAAVGIAISELDGRLAEVNAKFIEILGYPAHELVGLTAYDISHSEDVPSTRGYVARLLSGELPDYSYEKRYVRKDGSIVWTLTSVGLLRDPEGRPRQFVGVIEDISALKKAQEGERVARTEAERMGQLKDEFLATLSHELRTPISAILGWSQIVARRPMAAEELKGALQVIERNARAQTRLIDDLLDMSRITSGKVRLDVQPVEPAAFVEAALETVRPAAGAKHIRLEKVLDPKAGPISGDPARLQQVVWNLLSNAIKFTRPGGKVQVVLARVNSHVEVSVADTGIGIRPEFMPYVFDRFRQADGSTTRREGGLGIGLAIAKHLVELHGGSLHAHSAGQDRGTTFCVRLPVTAVHRVDAKEERVHPASAAVAPAPAEVLPDLAGLTLLVVDDQPDARELVRLLLEEAGARVMTAGNAPEALLLAEREKPQILITDIGMPEADGFDLLRQLRALRLEIPAIALTAFARSEDRTKVLRAGFRMHVSKPVEAAELCVAVASVAGRTGS
jgi:PAS domain S-box-containing protein